MYACVHSCMNVIFKLVEGNCPSWEGELSGGELSGGELSGGELSAENCPFPL